MRFFAVLGILLICSYACSKSAHLKGVSNCVYKGVDTCAGTKDSIDTNPCFFNGVDTCRTSNIDTDGDGLYDSQDNNPHNPCIPSQRPKYIGYDTSNTLWQKSDCDKDGKLNIDEVNEGTDPYDAPDISKVSYADLAFRWAPIVHQDVDVTGPFLSDHSLSGKSDYITAINFDGDWIATNNWDNISSFPAYAVSYYSVVESRTHWFILYAFFHPRDWEDVLLNIGEHENDMEGLMVIVKKDGTRFGKIEGGITVFHHQFPIYTIEKSSLTSSRNHKLRMELYQGISRPVIGSEAKGHGIKAEPYVSIKGNDGIIYYPSLSQSEEPSHPNDRLVQYKLVDIFEPNGFWSQRNNAELFNPPGSGKFDKSDHGSGGANAPWNWTVQEYSFAKHPAEIANRLFSTSQIDEVYINNIYHTN